MNKLWRLGNRLSKMGGVPRKISRLLELMNHLICACSVSIDAEIGDGTIFYHRGIGCVVHPKAVIGKNCKRLEANGQKLTAWGKLPALVIM